MRRWRCCGIGKAARVGEIRTEPGVAAPDPAGHGHAQGLKRALRLRDVALLYIAASLSVRWVATAAAAGPGSLIVWFFGLIGFFVPLAGCVMELSSRYPQEGGLYIWAREAFGDFTGFLAAWTYWMSNLPYFASILYFGAGAALFAAGERGHRLAASPAYFMTFAVVWLAIITLFNIAGLNAGKWLNNIGSSGAWLSVLVLVVLAAVAAGRFGVATRFSWAAMAPHLSLKDAIFWSTIFFAFSGAETGSFMAEEIEEPRKTIPRALLVSGFVLAVGYVAGTAALLVALPPGQVSGIDGFMHGAAVLCGRLGVPWLGVVMGALGQAGTSVRGAYDVMVSMTIITTFLPFLPLFAAMVRVQSRPAGEGVMRVPGGRPVATILAVVGFVSTAGTIVLSAIPADEEPNKPLALAKVLVSTAVLVGAGVVVFAIAQRKRRKLLRELSVNSEQ